MEKTRTHPPNRVFQPRYHPDVVTRHHETANCAVLTVPQAPKRCSYLGLREPRPSQATLPPRKRESISIPSSSLDRIPGGRSLAPNGCPKVHRNVRRTCLTSAALGRLLLLPDGDEKSTPHCLALLSSSAVHCRTSTTSRAFLATRSRRCVRRYLPTSTAPGRER